MDPPGATPDCDGSAVAPPPPVRAASMGVLHAPAADTASRGGVGGNPPGHQLAGAPACNNFDIIVAEFSPLASTNAATTLVRQCVIRSAPARYSMLIGAPPCPNWGLQATCMEWELVTLRSAVLGGWPRQLDKQAATRARSRPTSSRGRPRDCPPRVCLRPSEQPDRPSRQQPRARVEHRAAPWSDRRWWWPASSVGCAGNVLRQGKGHPRASDDIP